MMEEFTKIGSAAYDLEIMKKGIHIAAIVAEVFKNFPIAIKYYK